MKARIVHSFLCNGPTKSNWGDVDPDHIISDIEKLIHMKIPVISPYEAEIMSIIISKQHCKNNGCIGKDYTLSF